MRCHEAKEILSALIDGREDPRAELARAHLEDCPECREWHAGMQRVENALAASRATIPTVDFSAAIMARLPARHPASERAIPRSSTRKLVLVMAACWLLGAIMMGVGVVVWAYYYGGSPHDFAVSAKASARAAESAAKTGWATSQNLVNSGMNVLLQVLPNATRWIAGLVIADILILLFALALWRRRRALAGPISVLW